MQKTGYIIGPGHSYRSITEKITNIVLQRATPKSWFVGLLIGFLLLMGLLYAVTELFLRGVGIWGINHPVGWGFAIGLIGCYKGYTSQKGTAGVGRAANTAVVVASMLLFVIDFIAVLVADIFFDL